MNKRLFILLILFLTACTDKPLHSSPMLWEVSGNGLKSSSYLFGTYHSTAEKFNNLPPVVYKSLKRTQRFYSEVTMNKRSQLRVLNFSKLKKPIPLKHRLHPKTQKRLVKYLRKHKSSLTLRGLSLYKTWGIALMLNNVNEKDTLFMDQTLAAYAKEHNIKQAGLESVLEQLSYFDTLPKVLQEQLLLDTLSSKDDTRYTDALEEWYIKGQAQGFELLHERFASDEPKQKKLDKALFDGLLLERNIRLAKRIDILLKSKPNLRYFFAIGAGHLADKLGMLALLKKEGYTVRKVR